MQISSLNFGGLCLDKPLVEISLNIFKRLNLKSAEEFLTLSSSKRRMVSLHKQHTQAGCQTYILYHACAIQTRNERSVLGEAREAERLFQMMHWAVEAIEKGQSDESKFDRLAVTMSKREGHASRRNIKIALRAAAQTNLSSKFEKVFLHI